MGLDSRDYMNQDADEGASTAGLLSNLSLAHQLIAVNVVVWIAWQLFNRSPFLHDHFLVSAQGLLDQRRLWTVVTYAFSHIEAWHLFFNMLFLYWFGRDLERAIGRRSVLIVYLVGAVVGALAQVAFNLRDPLLRPAPMLGASAAVMAIVVTTTLLYPWRRVLLAGLVPTPLWSLAAVFVAVDLFGVARQVAAISAEGVTPALTRVGYAGHLGGALAGALFKVIDLRPSPRRVTDAAPARPWSWLGTAWRRRKLRVLPPLREEEPVPVRRREQAQDALPAAPAPQQPVGRIDPELEARVDDLLRKINREGLQSLTVEEKAFLDQASARYRK